MLNRRTVITFEKLERSTYRLLEGRSLMALCVDCDEDVAWLTPNQVVAITGFSLREVFRRIEAQSIHFHETESGLIEICLRSIEVI